MLRFVCEMRVGIAVSFATIIESIAMNLKSNEPFWLVKNGLLHSYPSLQEDHQTDVLIIGAGITGSLIGFQCVSEGYDTTILDKREVANGSTSATTSMLQYEIDVPLYKLIEQVGEQAAVASYKACFKSINKLEKIIAKIGSDSGFKRKESLYFAAMKKDLPGLEKEFETRKAYGFPVKWLTAEEILEKYELASTYGGILSAQGASIDAFRLTHDLLHYMANKGARICDKTPIQSVEYQRKKVKVTTASGYVITAKKLIYCNGFESVEVIPERFVKLLSTYAIVGEVSQELPKSLSDLLVWNTASPYMYLRSTDDNRLLIGGEDEDFLSDLKRDKFIKAKSKRLEKKVAKYYPQLTFSTDFAWAGTFGETKDGLPYIGSRSDFPHTYFVLGFGGNGITFSVVGMKMVSLHLQGKKHPLEAYFAFNR